MGYFPRSSADREKARDLFLPGHADWSTFSILFSQPISALQILDKANSWKWVQVSVLRIVIFKAMYKFLIRSLSICPTALLSM